MKPLGRFYRGGMYNIIQGEGVMPLATLRLCRQWRALIGKKWRALIGKKWRTLIGQQVDLSYSKNASTVVWWTIELGLMKNY